MLLSFKMFLYDGSIFELVHAQHTTAFLELYFFVFYAAVLTSTSAIIMLFGKRAMTLFALCFRKKKWHSLNSPQTPPKTKYQYRM